MKSKSFQWTQPSNKRAALGQILSCLSTFEQTDRKEKVVMDTIKSSQEKIERLQKHIDSLQETLQSTSVNKENIQKRIDYLKREFALTEAEILEAKSKLLREQIAELNRQNQTLTGETTLHES